MKKNILYSIITASISLNSYASDSFSYSGRLVHSNGTPVAGPVDLRFDLSSTVDPSDTLCSKSITSVPLSNGVFHVKLKFETTDCESNTLQAIMEALPANQFMTYQVTDITNSRTYAVQNMYAVPSSYMANFAKTIAQMGAVDGQVLKWNDTLKRWMPGNSGSGNGSVTAINTGPGLVGGPITDSGTIEIAPGGVTNAHLAGSIDPAKLAGTRDTTTYLKGDNTWSTFSTEVLNTILNGFSVAGSAVVTATDSILTAIEKLQGQTNELSNNKLDKTGGTLVIGTINGVPAPLLPDQIVNKQYVDDQLGGVTSSQWTTAAPHVYYSLGNVGIGTGTPNEKLQVAGNIALDGGLRLNDSGSNFVELRAPVTTAGVTFILPATAGTNGQVLKTDGTGVLSWGNSSVGSSDISDDSIVDADVSSSANIAQSKIQNLTSDLSGKEPTITSGTTGQYWRGDKSWQTLNSDVVPEGATNKYYSNSLARGAIEAASPISYDTGTGVIGMIAGSTGDLLQYNGSTWVPWSPDYLSAEADTLAVVTGRGATTSTAVTLNGGANFPGSGTWTAAGNVGIGTTTPRSKLDVVGAIQIGDDASTCDVMKVGAIRYNSGNVEYCNGGPTWQAFGVSGSGITNINGSTVSAHSFGAPGATGAAPNWVTVAATGVHTLNIPMANNPGVSAGLISKADYDAFDAKLETTTSFAGDVNGTYNSTSVDRVKGTPVVINTLTSGQILKFDGTNWINAAMTVSDLGSGVLPVSRGGTNTSSLSGDRIMLSTATAIVEAPALTDGQLLIGSTGATPVAATLTAGTGVSITNSAGGITINATGSGGTVTNVTGTAPISVATGSSTPVVSISQASASTNGYLSSTDWNTFNNKQSPLSAGATINGVTYPANGTLPLQVTLAPVNLTDVVNKQYVDSFGQWGTSAGNVYRTSGNVGIGTSTPGSALEVAGQVKITGGTPGAGKVLTSDASGLASWQTPVSGADNLGNHTATQNIRLGSYWLSGDGGNEGLRVDATGNIGIGTGTPAANLHISAADPVSRVESTSATGLSILEIANDADELVEVYMMGSGATGTTAGVPNANLGVISYSANGVFMIRTGDGTTPLVLAPGNAEAMRFLPNGNVGVGTSAPGAKLEVAGQVKITGGAPGAGKVLTSDAAGLATWTTPAAGGITNLNGSTVASQSFAVPGTSGTAPAWSTVAGTGVHTLNIPLASATSVTAGLISKTDYDNFNTKLGSATSFSGDVSGAYNATSVDKIKGTGVAITTLTSGNFLRYNGTNWVNAMLAATDIPNLDAAKITTGVLPVSRGGTNNGTLVGNRIMVSTASSIVEAPAMTNGQLLIGSTGATPVAATLTAGTGVTISNTAGGITINATGSGGTVTNVTGTAPISVATGSSTPVVSISQASASTNGYLSSTDWNTFNNKQAPLSAGATINGIVYPADGTQTLQIPLAPVNLTDAVNKQYVDSFGLWGTSSGNVYRSTGNVGIGTTSPGASLEVAGQVKITGGTPGAGKVLTSDAAGLASWQTPAGGSGDFMKDGSVAMTGQFLATDGTSTTPSITFSSETGLGFFKAIPGTVGFASGGNFPFRMGNDGILFSTNSTASIRNVTGVNWPTYTFNSDPNTGISNPAADVLSISTGGNERVRVDSAGKVGIGTSTPVAKLDVSGEVKFGNTSSTCNSTNEGQQRYNSTSKKMEFCNGTSWTAYGASGITACPSGWSMIGASGKPATYCIQQGESIAPNFWSAMDTCHGINDASLGRGHLCTMNEWYTACKIGTGLSNMTDNTEMVSQTNGSASYITIGGASCNTIETDAFNGSWYYRCCIK